MSIPTWWGDWRPTLTPHVGNLQATDLIECTSIVLGSPVNNVITGAQIIAGAGGALTVGTTAIASGTVGRVLFEGAGNVLEEDAGLFYDNTNKRLGVGATPLTTVRLDVRAQDALSTSLAFRVRNSADTQNIIQVRNNGDVYIGLNAGAVNTGVGNSFFGRSAGTVNSTGINNSFFGTQAGQTNSTGGSNAFFGALAGGNNQTQSQNVAIGFQAGFALSTGAAATAIINSIFIGRDSRPLNDTQTNQIVIGESARGLGSNSIAIGNTTTTLFKLWGAGLLQNVTAPAAAVIDNFHIYANDIVAGNSAPHFRTEAGNVIKLYRETTAVASAAFVVSAGTAVNTASTFAGFTLAQVVQALRNHGLLA